jgi:hypothetical protein
MVGLEEYMSKIDQIHGLTDEQKKKFKKLNRKYQLKGAISGIKIGLIFSFGTIFVGLMTNLYVHNNGFAFIGGILNGIMCFNIFKYETKKNHDSIAGEVKEILEND